MTAPLPSPSPRQRLLLGLIVGLLAVIVFFGGLELALRLSGFGHSPRFFRTEIDPTGRRWIRENPWVTAPFFSPELMRRPLPFRIPAAKPPGTYRIFVLGSSAAMGDPNPSFSIARMLEVMLRDAFPKVRFEVVNAGITAINSQVVRPIAADCAELQPDLYIVYEGNNEVIGPYGPGTVFASFLESTSMIRVVQALRSTRTGQLIATIAHKLGPERKQLAAWGGMEMFLRHTIARDDPRLVETDAAFGDNLRSISAAGAKAGATVFLCNVLTNEKDFSPFQSQHRPGLPAAELRRWDALFSAGRQAAAAGDDAFAEKQFRAALAIDAQYAELPFELGRLCLRENRDAAARSLFQQALDLDVLRFRTDSLLNATIKAVPRKRGIEFVDLVAAAEKQSPHGILGNEFLYEHVHLTFQGTYLVARTLFPRIAADLQRRQRIATTAPIPVPLSIASVARRLAYTIYDEARIVDDLHARLSVPPFTACSDNAARVRALAEQEQVLGRELAAPTSRQAIAQFYDDAVKASPDDWILQRNAGILYTKLGDELHARALLERAKTMMPDDLDTLYALAGVEQKLGDSAAATRDFATLRQLEPRYPGLPAIKG